MLSIRFSRIGKKKMPHFRIIVLDKQKDPFGAFLENLGSYNPRTKELNINIERTKFWLSKGAEASSTVHNILIEKKIIDGKKKRVSHLSKKRKEKLTKKIDKEKKETPASVEPSAAEIQPTETDKKS